MTYFFVVSSYLCQITMYSIPFFFFRFVCDCLQQLPSSWTIMSLVIWPSHVIPYTSRMVREIPTLVTKCSTSVTIAEEFAHRDYPDSLGWARGGGLMEGQVLQSGCQQTYRASFRLDTSGPEVPHPSTLDLVFTSTILLLPGDVLPVKPRSMC